MNTIGSSVTGVASKTFGTGKSAIYDRNYPALRRFSWVWRGLATYWTFVTWACTIPWQILRWLAPSNLQDNLTDFQRNFLGFVTPAVNFVQDTSYKFFSFADYMTDWTIHTATHFYHNNLKGFEHTFDHALSNIEHRARILTHEGLAGIPNALSFDVHHKGALSTRAPMGDKILS